MRYSITRVTEEELTLTNINEINDVLVFPMVAIDTFAFLNVGSLFDIEDAEIPYCISNQRRQDIRAHHEEEALCGNL